MKIRFVNCSVYFEKNTVQHLKTKATVFINLLSYEIVTGGYKMP